MESERLVFKLIEEADLPNIHLLHSLPETDRYNTLGMPKDIDSTKKIIMPWIEQHSIDPITNYTIAIRTKDQDEFIGLLGLKLNSPKTKRAEIWYKIHKDYWSKGLGTEAVNGIIDFCFGKLDLHRVEAGCAVDNIASIKVLEKVGMIREGRKRKVLPLVTGWSDNFEYAILLEDWNKMTQI